jgi:hypothetical protein
MDGLGLAGDERPVLFTPPGLVSPEGTGGNRRFANAEGLTPPFCSLWVEGGVGGKLLCRAGEGTVPELLRPST